MLYKFNLQLSFKADRGNEMMMYMATVKHDVNTLHITSYLRVKPVSI